MRQRSIRRAFALALALLALVASACGSDDTDQASADPGSSGTGGEVVLRVGVPSTWGYLSTMQERNVQPEGVRVEYKLFPFSIDARAALNAGQIDLLETGDVGASQAFLAGKGNVRVVALSAPNPDQMGFIVRNNSDIRTAADLKGKTVSVSKTTNGYPAVLRLIEEAGLSTDDVEIVDLAAEAFPALLAGEVDVVTQIEPTLSAQLEGNPLRLFSTFDGYGENVYPYLASKSAIDTKGEAIEKFLVALQETMQWITDNRDEHAELMTDHYGSSTDAIKTGYERGSGKLQVIDDAFLDHAQAIIDDYLELGIIDQPVSARELYIADYNRIVR